MKYYKKYMDRQQMSPEGHRKLLELGEQPPARRPSKPRPWRRWGALAACCALVLGLGIWQLTAPEKEPQIASDALYPGIKDTYGPGEDPENRFEVEGPEGEKLMLPAIPYINYQSVDGLPAADSAPARWLTEGSFARDLTREDIQTIFWGPEGKPESDNEKEPTGDLPWMLFWGGYTLTGSALYAGDGTLLWVNLWGENDKTGGSFTLTLRPGELPFNCGLYSDLETTEVFGVPVTGWSREEDGAWVCCSEFMAGEVGVRFENRSSPFGSEYGEAERDLAEGGAQMFNALLVRQGLSTDGGFTLDHLMTAEDVPEWREEEYASLEAARQETAFAPWLPEETPAGYGEFYGRMTWQQGLEHTMYLRWSRGYDDVTMMIYLPEGETVWGNVVDVDRPETYDVRLYPVPRADSVPEEYRETVDHPVFRAEDMSRDLVAARAYTAEDAGDTGGVRMSFSVLHPDNTLVQYDTKGLSVEELWALVEPTLGKT